MLSDNTCLYQERYTYRASTKIWVLCWQMLNLFMITGCLEKTLVTRFVSEVVVFASNMCQATIKNVLHSRPS